MICHNYYNGGMTFDTCLVDFLAKPAKLVRQLHGGSPALNQKKIYSLAFSNVLIFCLWTAVMVFVFRPTSIHQATSTRVENLPNLGSLAVEQLGQRLRISFVSYLGILDMVLPGLTTADQSSSPTWFERSFAAHPILTPDGPCEWDMPGWTYQEQRLSLQVLAYCPGTVPSWQWDLSFLLGPLSHGSLQMILVDDGVSEVVELNGRQLHFKMRRLTIAAANKQDQDG
ncbi:MAG: hypothetical protein ACOH5I_00760 [Oligoflexus sp.]